MLTANLLLVSVMTQTALFGTLFPMKMPPATPPLPSERPYTLIPARPCRYCVSRERNQFTWPFASNPAKRLPKSNSP